MASQLLFATSAAVTVADDTTDVDILTVPGVSGFSTLTAEVSNIADGATLTSFKVKLQDHPDGEWYDYLSDADFLSTSISNLLFCSTTAPHTLASGSKAHIHVRLNGASAVKFTALCATSTTVEVRGTMDREA